MEGEHYRNKIQRDEIYTRTGVIHHAPTNTKNVSLTWLRIR